MFYEYAVDPSILSDFNRCKLFFNSFTNHPSRLVSDLPKKWVQSAFNEINKIPHEKCPPIKKKTLKEKLKKLLRDNLSKNRIISDSQNNQPWLDYAVHENSVYPFAAILSTNEISEPVKIYEFDDLSFNYPLCWNMHTQAHIKREATIIVEASLPLLKISKKLKLVDPYFSFTNPSWEYYKLLLVKLFSIINECNFGNGIPLIEIHTSDRKGGVQYELDSKVKPLLPESISLICYQWPSNNMHDRFILTDIGGINFGQGLSDATDNGLQEVLINSLDNKTHKTELSKLGGSPVTKSSI